MSATFGAAPLKRRRVDPTGTSDLIRQPLQAQHSRQRALQATLEHLPYWASHDLKVHTSCVNALAFSRDGQLFASGGDDMRVLLFETNQVEDEPSNVDQQPARQRNDHPENCRPASKPTILPKATLRGNKANIFTIAFSCTNTQVFSSGIDGRIKQHDLNIHAPDLPSSVFGGGDFPLLSEIRHLSCHPDNENLVMAANDLFSVSLYDARESRRPVRLLSSPADVTYAEINPAMPNLFLSSTSAGEIMLHDFRQLSSSQSTPLRESCMTNYTTGMSRRDATFLARTEATSFCFDPSGQLFTALLSKSQPTVYSIADETPLATLHADGYANQCTIKHGSFGQSSDQNLIRYSCGSDDFNVYSWDIPLSPGLLAEQRQTRSFETWASTPHQDLTETHFASSLSSERVLPAQYRQPVHALPGHRSIVNVRGSPRFTSVPQLMCSDQTVLHHPSLPMMFSSGVEKCIKVWKPSQEAPATPPARERGSAFRAEDEQPGGQRAAIFIAPDQLREGSDDVDEDEECLAMFDTIRSIEQRRGDLFADPQDSDPSDEELEDSTEEEEEGDGEPEEGQQPRRSRFE